MVYGLTEEADNFFTTQFGFLFLISFLHFVFSNGYATLVFIENEYPDYLIGELYPNSSIFDLPVYDSSDNSFIIDEYRRQVGYKVKWAPRAMAFFYYLMHVHALMIFKVNFFEEPKSI